MTFYLAGPAEGTEQCQQQTGQGGVHHPGTDRGVGTHVHRAMRSTTDPLPSLPTPPLPTPLLPSLAYKLRGI